MLFKLSQGQQYLIVSLTCPPSISLTVFRVLKNAGSQLKYIIEVVSMVGLLLYVYTLNKVTNKRKETIPGCYDTSAGCSFG